MSGDLLVVFFPLVCFVMSVAMTLEQFAVAPRVILEFLRKTLPFNELDAGVLDDLSRRWIIDYSPRGTLVFRQDVTEVSHLYLVQKGGVRIYSSDGDAGETLKDYCGEGASLGAVNLLRGHKAEANVEAVEDTYFFLLEKSDFLALLENSPRLTPFYLQRFPDEHVAAAYATLRCERILPRKQESLFLVNTKVQAIIRHAPEMIASSATVQETAARMAELGIGSLLVRSPAGTLAGIVTDQDLRTRVVAEGLDHSASVEQIMASPVHTIPAHALCFDALLCMMKQNVNHLVVESRKQVIGVVTANDIMVYQGTWPIYLFRQVAAQRRIEGLYDLAKKVPMAVRTLIMEGAKGTDPARVLTLLNDSILERLLDLLCDEFGPPPAPFCWLTFNRDGRREQAFRTEQHNALIYRDLKDKRQIEVAEDYFGSFAVQACNHLLACGFPRGKREITASNPRWRKPYSVWEAYFEEWLAAPGPRDAYNSALFFDFRAAYGDTRMSLRLRRRLTDQALRQHAFLRHLATECLRQWPPLAFFRDLVVYRDGEQRNRLDLEKGCLGPVVDFARLMALKYGIEETNTVARLRSLSRHGHISPEICADVLEAYEFATQMQLVHQLEQVEDGLPIDGYIDPADLSSLEMKTLKDSFEVLKGLREIIRLEFPALI